MNFFDGRNSSCSKQTHTVNADFDDLLNGLEQRLEYVKENMSLLEASGLAHIEAFQTEAGEKVVRDEI